MKKALAIFLVIAVIALGSLFISTTEAQLRQPPDKAQQLQSEVTVLKARLYDNALQIQQYQGVLSKINSIVEQHGNEITKEELAKLGFTFKK